MEQLSRKGRRRSFFEIEKGNCFVDTLFDYADIMKYLHRHPRIINLIRQTINMIVSSISFSRSRLFDSRLLDSRLLDSRLLDPRFLDPRFLDPRFLDPRFLDLVFSIFIFLPVCIENEMKMNENLEKSNE